MDSPSEFVRVTIPLPRSLVDQLSVLAWRSDLTRPQLLRRYLTISAREAMRRYADLEGASPSDWYAAAYRLWQEDTRAEQDRAVAEVRAIAEALPRVEG